jgi:hypothetical protein
MHARLLTFLLLVTISVPAAAQRSVTVIGIDGDSVDGATSLAISAGLLRGASDAADVDVVDYTNVTLDDVVQLVGCSGVELRCLIELANTLETDVLVYGELSDESADDVVLDLTLFDAFSDEIPEARPIALPDEGVLEFVAARTQAFLDGNAVVTITANSSGDVLVDGELVGPAPVTLTSLAPGVYELSLELADGRSSILHAEIDTVGEHAFEIRVPRGRAPTGDDGQGGLSIRVARVAGWTSITLGLGAFGVATYHGTEVANAQQRFDATPYQSEAYAIANDGRRSARASNTFVAIGAGLTAVGIVAVVLDRLPSDDPEADAVTWALAPTEGGALGVFRWSQ